MARTSDKHNIWKVSLRDGLGGGRCEVWCPADRGIKPIMNLRRVIVLVGAVVLLVGVIALLVPVSIAGPDGQKISCGNAIAADDSAASQANANDPNQLKNLPIIDELTEDPPDYVAQCHSAVGDRRTWAIPVAIVGLVVLVGGFLVGGRTARAG